MHHTEDKSHGRVGHGIQGEDKGRKGQRNTSQNLDERGAGSREEGEGLGQSPRASRGPWLAASNKPPLPPSLSSAVTLDKS